MESVWKKMEPSRIPVKWGIRDTETTKLPSFIFVQMSNETNPGCLGYIGDYTTQVCGDDSKPL